jgi:hypothetical protein
MSSYAIARGSPRPSTRAVLLQVAAGVLVAAVAIELTIAVTRRTALNGVVIVILVAGSLWFATTRRTQLALVLLMLYLGLLDGYLKLATGSGLVTFVRDVLLYAIVAGVLVRAIVTGKRLAWPPLSGWVIAFVVLVFVQLANPRAGTFYHSLAGVRQHLEFVPLFFLTYAFIRTTKALRGFVILLAVIAAANGVVGLVQFNETPQQFASWGPGYEQRVLGTGIFSGGGRTFAGGQGPSTRPFGLGSDAGDGGLLGALAIAGIVALASVHRRPRYLGFAVAAAAGATLGVITSEGRGVIVATVIVLLVFGLLTATSRSRIKSLLGLALVIATSVIVVQAIVGSAGSGVLRYQGLGPSSLVQTTSKARGTAIAAIPHNLVSFPFGAGLGTAGPATSASGGSPLVGNVNTETEFSFLTVETGIPGMLVLTGFAITLLALGVRRCRYEPDREARVLLAALIAPIGALLALFFISVPSDTVPPGPYLWAVGGIVSYWLVALPAARRREAASTRKSLELPPRVSTAEVPVSAR